MWKELLDRSPADAPWREDLEAKIARIDSMVGPALTDPAGAKPSPSPEASESGAP